LEKRFEIAPMTLRNAMRVLREEGLIYTVQGRGTFVQSTPEQQRDVVRISPAQVAVMRENREHPDDKKAIVSVAKLDALRNLIEAQGEQITQLAEQSRTMAERIEELEALVHRLQGDQ
jgi:GntR family transcriptional regulator